MLTEDGCILYPEQCKFLCYVAFCSFISALYAFYKEKYDLGIVVFGVFLTSILYWYQPTHCWRRTLDVVYVKFALFYHTFRAYNSEFYLIYYITLAMSLCFYPLGIYLYNKKLYWESTYAHSMVHIISNISNLILYSGTILPLTNYVEYFGIGNLDYFGIGNTFGTVTNLNESVNITECIVNSTNITNI